MMIKTRLFDSDKSAPIQPQAADRQLSAPPASGSSSPAADAEACMQPLDAGPCRGHFERWFFDQFTRKCVSFAYSGCLGMQCSNFPCNFRSILAIRQISKTFANIDKLY